MNKSSNIDSIGSKKAVQIITPGDHSFELKLDVLKRILGDEKIKDHDVVVVSIAGAFRTGKSFLMNFFLKYLYAQYKTHNVSDWIGEKKTETLKGFTWRGGKGPETIGLWIWPEIFTYELENDRNIAIILMDSQGLFDDETSMKKCVASFVITTLISSIQCVNIMQQIQADHLQHLDLFTEYGRLLKAETNAKPFQKLLFIVRDWPYPYETKFGFNRKYIDQKLAGNSKQTTEMLELRKRIRSSFEEINAYLMPYPGKDVAHGKSNVKLSEMSPDFVQYVKELVPALLAPKNLVVKEINGQTLKPRDLIACLQQYIKLFDGDELPDPQSVLTATASISNNAIHTKHLNMYNTMMQRRITSYQTQTKKPYIPSMTLYSMNCEIRRHCEYLFQNERKLGGSERIKDLAKKLSDDVDLVFSTFEQKNKIELNTSIKKSELARKELEMIYSGCFRYYVDNMEREFSLVRTYFEELRLKGIHGRAKSESLSKFQRESTRVNSERVLEFRTKLVGAIEERFKVFLEKNENKRNEHLFNVCAGVAGAAVVAVRIAGVAGVAGTVGLAGAAIAATVSLFGFFR